MVKKYADGGETTATATATATPSFFERVKKAITPAPAKPTPAPNYDANQVAGQGIVGQAQANRMTNIDNAERKAAGFADGGMSCHNPDNRLQKGVQHKGRGHG